MKNFLNTIVNILAHSAFLGPVLYLGWNFALVKFIPVAPKVELLDAMALLGALQTLLIFTIRPVRQEILPIYVPASERAPNE